MTRTDEDSFQHVSALLRELVLNSHTYGGLLCFSYMRPSAS